MLPPAGIRALDFSALLLGPMASLFLVDDGAKVIKIELRDMGNERRTCSPRLGDVNANLALSIADADRLLLSPDCVRN